jgi:hypothetical protein
MQHKFVEAAANILPGMLDINLLQFSIACLLLFLLTLDSQCSAAADYESTPY